MRDPDYQPGGGFPVNDLASRQADEHARLEAEVERLNDENKKLCDYVNEAAGPTSVLVPVASLAEVGQRAERAEAELAALREAVVALDKATTAVTPGVSVSGTSDSEPARDERRWTLWRVHIGSAVGQWNARERLDGDPGVGMVESVRVMPVSEFKAALANWSATAEAAMDRALEAEAVLAAARQDRDEWWARAQVSDPHPDSRAILQLGAACERLRSERNEARAELAAARQVDDAMVERALGATWGSTSVHDLGDPYFKSIHKDIMRAALLAALNPEGEAMTERTEQSETE
jgi:hypothetical protein